jgi:ABC-type uncharacterized transport system involved in gliding motility auxiliary subunit
MLNRGGNLVITRGTLGTIGSFISGTGLIIGVLSILWQSGFSTFTGFSFVVGLIGLALWVYMTPADFKNFIMGRQAKRGTVAVFSTLLVVGIIAMLYIFTLRTGIVIDMTQGERFTLSKETLEVIDAANRSVEARIRITGFYAPLQLRLQEIDNQYWELYNGATDKITLEYIDPLAEPAKAAPYGAYLTQGINVFVAFEDENGDLIFQSTIPVAGTRIQERDMTEAITRLLLRGRFKVYFESGLDTLSAGDESAEGASIVNSLLRTNGIETNALNLAQLADSGNPIPVDASAVIFARPKRQLTQAEIDIIDAYVQQGGSLFIFTDVILSPDSFLQEDSVFNSYLWDTFGLRALDYVVIDEASSQETSTNLVSAAVYPGNPIGENMDIENDPQSSTLFRLARPIEVDETPPVNNGSVILTSPFSWAESDVDRLIRDNQREYNEGDDIQGPVTTVAWANNKETGSKLVIVGDTDFMTNGQILSPQGNSILFFDSIGWMTGFTEEVSFEPQILATGLPIIFIDIQTIDLIAFATLILMPGVMLVFAIAIWGRRLR